MSKEIALGFAFGKAPESLQKAAKDVNDAFILAEKAKAQIKAWRVKLELQNARLAELSPILEKELNAWNPTGETVEAVKA